MFALRCAPLGFESITDLSGAAGLTVPAGANLALIDAVGQNVRWRDDGTAPTTTVGMLLLKDTPFEYSGDLSAIQFIEVTSGADLNVSYYKIVG